MRAKVFKSLTKPVFWGGLPRELFIFLFMFQFICFVSDNGKFRIQ